jgi:hypothetical protein
MLWTGISIAYYSSNLTEMITKALEDKEGLNIDNNENF